MSRPPKSGEDKRTNIVRVRLTPAEKTKLWKLASEAGFLPSDFIRQGIFQSKPLRTVATPDRSALIKLQAELGKIGSNLNQIAHVLNTCALNGEPVQRSQTAIDAVLAQVDFTVKSVQEELQNGH